MIAKLLILKILQLFAIMLIGFIIAKLNIINVKDSVALSRIAVYLLMPSAIINAADFEQSNSLKKGLLLAFAALWSDMNEQDGKRKRAFVRT